MYQIGNLAKPFFLFAQGCDCEKRCTGKQVLFDVLSGVKEFMWWKVVKLEHVHTCPMRQSQGNEQRKDDSYWVQRCVSVRRGKFRQGVYGLQTFDRKTHPLGIDL